MDTISWINIYSDLPSKQLKIPVSNKQLIQCSEDEMKVLSPSALQLDLDQHVDNVKNGRCFVRPSGTEDVVRIYAEAATASEASNLVEKAVEVIRNHVP
jgi:phosphoacetylglucosamine mutase